MGHGRACSMWVHTASSGGAGSFLEEKALGPTGAQLTKATGSHRRFKDSAVCPSESWLR